MALRNATAWASALTIFAAGTLLPVSAYAQTTREPAKNSPLKRTNTKLKPKAAKPASSAPKTTKPLGAFKPVGRKHTAKSMTDFCIPMDAIQRALFGQNDLQRTVRSNTSGDIDVEFDGSSARVSEVFTRDGMPTQDRAMHNVITAVRDGRSASTNEELQDMVRGTTKKIDDVRADYLARGFQEVEINNNETVFVKADDPRSAGDFQSMLEDRVSEHMYRAWLDDWGDDRPRNEWIYETDQNGNGCRTCTVSGVCAPSRALDTFILRGTFTPSSEPTEDELAELDMTDAELAENALRLGDYSLAVERYEVCLKGNPEDATSLRGFAVALMQENRLPEAITKMGDAYRLDPSLADEPISLEYFDDGAGTITDLLQRLVPMAHKSPTHQASLTAAVLMQAQGRTKEARRMLDRASQKGLPDSIEREFLLGRSVTKTAATGK